MWKSIIFGVLVCVVAGLAWQLHQLQQSHNQLLLQVSQAESPLTKSDIENLMATAFVQREEHDRKQRRDKALSGYSAAAKEVTKRHLYGNLEAPITLVEFSDTRCPYCQQYQPIIKNVVEASKGRVNAEYRHYILDSHQPQAGLQAIVLECVAEHYGNRVFWAFLDKTFSVNPTTKDDFAHLAEQIDLDIEIIGVCATQDKAGNRVKTDRQLAQSLGISTTPSTLIRNNDTGKSILLRGLQDETRLIQAIQSILR